MIEEILRGIGSIYYEAEAIAGALLWVLGIFGIHIGLYWAIGFFFTRKFEPAKNLHKYAICIPARNEEAVIGNLIDSILYQDYPKEWLTIFVVADNCTDNTARIAREKGAVCYERFDDVNKTKGFALQFLFQKLERDYGTESFEGYFIFDADNLLNRDYVSRMNDAFDAGEKIITSYRNTKNFDENWIASTYALHWLRSIRMRHRARSVLRLATNIQGTGFLFANELIRDGWKYTSLTEDRAFTADAVVHGYKISYNDAAVFYDEQPVSLRVALRQRLRWAKGHLLAFMESGWPLFKNIFVGNCFRDKMQKRRFTKEVAIEEIRHRLAAFDTFAQLIPSAVIKIFLWLFVSVVLYGCHCFANGTEVLWYSLGLVILAGVIKRLRAYLSNILVTIYLFIVERRRMKKIPWYKKILYCVTWPTFDIIHRCCLCIALFKNVTWKAIPHTSKVTITDVEK